MIFVEVDEIVVSTGRIFKFIPAIRNIRSTQQGQFRVFGIRKFILQGLKKIIRFPVTAALILLLRFLKKSFWIFSNPVV